MAMEVGDGEDSGSGQGHLQVLSIGSFARRPSGFPRCLPLHIRLKIDSLRDLALSEALSKITSTIILNELFDDI